MKKMFWKRKSGRRKRRRERDRGVVDLIKVTRHFFSELPRWLSEMEDPRHPSYTTYTKEDLVFMGIMKNACSVESMRKMEDLFNEENCIRTLAILSGDQNLEEMPHSDTLNYFLSKLPPSCLGGLRTKMVRSLIRSKSFNKARLLNKHWRVILDGTGLFSFRERHCENCLKQAYKGEDGKRKTFYCHKVLEAKLVLGDGFVVSLGTEFIENESEDVSKQDCEINAAKRLIPRLKEEFPRLPVVIQADALYEAGPIMEMCRKAGWEYIFTHKDTRQRAVGEFFGDLEDEDKTVVECVGAEHGTGKFYNGVGDLAGKNETMNLFEYEYLDKESGKPVRFLWTTSIRLSGGTQNEMIYAARGRWMIENEGFNTQKNVLYDIEHLNSKNPTAMKNHYLLTQIADILFQLYMRWNVMAREFGQGIKNTSSRLLESFRTRQISDEDVLYIEEHTSMYLE